MSTPCGVKVKGGFVADLNINVYGTPIFQDWKGIEYEWGGNIYVFRSD